MIFAQSARRRPFALRILAGAVLLLGLPVAGHAQEPGPATGFTPGQNTGIVTPKLPAAPVPMAVTPPPAPTAPSPTSQADAVLLPVLKGLVFVAGSGALKADGMADAGPSGVDLAQLPLLDDPKFLAQMRTHLGQPFRAGDLQQVRDQAKAWYVAHRHPFVDIAIPPQNISSGVVQVVVSEYRLGQVEVVDNHYFSDHLVRRPNTLKPGEIISLDVLQDDVGRLNENPFLSVDAEFKAGRAPGTTDMVLRASDRLPVRVYGGYDNQGVPTLDVDEWNVGANWGNVFGTGQIASYQYTRAFNGRFQAHSASDVIALTPDDKILVFGNYATMVSEAALGPFLFTSNGHAAQASGRFVHTLPRWGALTGHLQIGYDYKFTDNNALFDEISLGPPSAAETHQFPLIVDGALADRFGSTTLENDLIWAPGGLSSRDNNAAFQALVAGSQARYLYDRLSVTRTENLPGRLTLIVRGVLQRSNAILPNSEQLGGGGQGSVRGYYPDTGLGSDGELLNIELRLPTFSLGRRLGLNGAGDSAQLGAFYDYASLGQPTSVENGLAGAGNGSVPMDLASTGFLLHYSVGRYADLNFDMGWQLRRSPGEDRLGNYAAIALVFSN